MAFCVVIKNDKYEMHKYSKMEHFYDIMESEMRYNVLWLNNRK